MNDNEKETLYQAFINVIKDNTKNGSVKWYNVNLRIPRKYDASECFNNKKIKNGTRIRNAYEKYDLMDILKTKVYYKNEKYMKMFLVNIKLENESRVDLLYEDKKKNDIVLLLSSKEFEPTKDLYETVKNEKNKNLKIMKSIINFYNDEKKGI